MEGWVVVDHTLGPGGAYGTSHVDPVLVNRCSETSEIKENNAIRSRG